MGSRLNIPGTVTTRQPLDANRDLCVKECGGTSRTSSALTSFSGEERARSALALLGSSSSGGGAAAVAARLKTPHHPDRRRFSKGASNHCSKGSCPGKFCEDDDEQGCPLVMEKGEMKTEKPTEALGPGKKQSGTGAAVGIEATVDERLFELPLKVCVCQTNGILDWQMAVYQSRGAHGQIRRFMAHNF